MTPADLDSLIFENAPTGLAYTEDRVIKRCNARFGAIFAHEPADLEGQSIATLYPSRDDYDHTGQHWTRELGDHGAYADERIMRRGTGELFWCRVRGQSFDQTAPLSRAVWAFSDLSGERPIIPLSPRERQVGMLLVEGLTAKEIGRRLGISPRTVHVHKTRLMKRFGSRNSLDLVRTLATLPS